MNIGLYFGSFNPIHHGHLIIATHIINNSALDELWFVVSPQNPLKKSGSLLNEQHRLNLVRTAIEGEPKLKASSIEFKLPRPSYTIDTLAYLHDKYPGNNFSIIMGSDAYANIQKWKNYQALLANYQIYIYIRPGFKVLPAHQAGIILMDAPLLEISSTHIRELIRKKQNIRYLVPDSVRDQIEIHQYYASKLENPSQ